MTGTEILLTLSNNGKAMTFSADDYLTLRQSHRFVGKLSGMPAASAHRSNNCNGMPAIYNDYETKLMVDLGIVKLVQRHQLRAPPSSQKKLLYDKLRNKVMDELQEPYISSRLKATKASISNIIKGKKKKLMKSGVLESDINITEEEILEEEEARLRQSMSYKEQIQIPTQHPFLNDDQQIEDFPIKNDRKSKIFQDLWKKGFYITTGDSFGSDFLAYPGDPMYFHASQVVHIVDSLEQFDFKHLISCARLSVAVNKKCVFAYVTADDSVVYQTLCWDNPKLRQLYPVQLENASVAVKLD